MTPSILFQLKVHCYREKKDMMAKIGFMGRPDIKVVGKPVNPYLVSSTRFSLVVISAQSWKNLFMPYVNKKYSDGPAHPQSNQARIFLLSDSREIFDQT